MNKERKKVSISTLIWAMALVCIITLALCGFYFRAAPAQGSGVNRDGNLSKKMSEINAIVDKYYINPEGETVIDHENMEDVALFMYIRALGDRYSYYTNAEGTARQNEETAGHFTGIGVTATATEDDIIEIIEVYDGSPAEAAGLLTGDLIVGVDGTSVYEVGYQNGVDLVLGEADTDVVLDVLRGDEELTFTITRKTIDLDAVTYRMLEDNIGYIRIRSFNDVTYDGFMEALDELQAQTNGSGLSGIIFDLRNNTGGGLQSIVSVLDEILPEGQIVKLVDKAGNEKIYSSDADEIDLPMAVLVNESTASASELFAGSLRDYGKAKLVGTTTYGKGCAISTFPLSDGSVISIVTEMYYTASGANFEGVGIEPDVVVELSDEQRRHIFALDENEDPQLRSALDILKGE
ncbi:MAG: S41 family peptidase [Clostridia bacterium]|nr:S41 family peptidase [Clostridia bacterium]